MTHKYWWLCHRVIFPWGFCHGGLCRGGFCHGGFVIDPYVRHIKQFIEDDLFTAVEPLIKQLLNLPNDCGIATTWGIFLI